MKRHHRPAYEPKFLRHNGDNDLPSYDDTAVFTGHQLSPIRKVSATMSIGPDHLKMLQDLARSYCENRSAFDDMVMPRTPDGLMVGRIEVEALKFGHNGTKYGTYGDFVKHQVRPTVTRLERELAAISNSDAKIAKVDLWLREAAEGSPLMWALSAPSIRSVIFPGAYESTGDTESPLKRIDGVRYEKLPASVRHLEGTQVKLPNLEPATVAEFNARVLEVSEGKYPVETMGPVSL